ncbi:unnamed protein product [Notodromas monacha]|uniref:procollagen-lysine 5-dioxygenase n=1 Tax=Notodromas monacha TaxID=399045 RepID=A0A7R9BRY0_9CRUS|nr:unnamed protein product [Notodromas monacha]CAG0919662.1 unnamed protein product [Notodromas monacha]
MAKKEGPFGNTWRTKPSLASPRAKRQQANNVTKRDSFVKMQKRWEMEVETSGSSQNQPLLKEWKGMHLTKRLRCDDLPFNKGTLMNAGTLEAEKLGNYDCFIYHDVDLIPENKMLPYQCFPWPLHMAISVEKRKYKVPAHFTYAGGVLSVSKEVIYKINGYSNNFWGWGSEDDDIYNSSDTGRDAWTDSLQRIGRSKGLRRSRHLNPTSQLEESSKRSSEQVGLKNHEDHVVLKISKIIESVTELYVRDADAAEDLQLANYGTGGHYIVHSDHIRVTDAMKHSNPLLQHIRLRLATFMTYITEVTAGGSTAFSIARTAVKSEKGSTVFWWILNSQLEEDFSTRHGGCPVLLGSKWIANKWIFAPDGQMFKNPCIESPSKFQSPEEAVLCFADQVFANAGLRLALRQASQHSHLPVHIEFGTQTFENSHSGSSNIRITGKCGYGQKFREILDDSSCLHVALIQSFFVEHVYRRFEQQKPITHVLTSPPFFTRFRDFQKMLHHCDEHMG